MKKARNHHVLMIGLLLAAVPACQTYRPTPVDQVDFLQRAQTQTQGNVTVTAAVLSDDESARIFGRPLAEKNMQPVWLSIENNEDVPYALIPRAIDAEYYSGSEAAYMNRVLSAGVNKQMGNDFRDKIIDIRIKPGQKNSGFVITQLDEGIKVVYVMLFGPFRVRHFIFYVPVPGLQADYHRVDFDTLYKEDQFVRFENEEEFRTALANFAPCTRNKEDTKDGDPLNLVLIGTEKAVFGALARAGWDETEVLTSSTAIKTARAFLRDTRYRYAPISPQYVYGRVQDIALQKGRHTIHERNHMRLWLTPWIFKGQRVWIGQISRDIGIRITAAVWYLATHAIDPEVDEARDYLLQDVMAVQGLARFGYAEGVGEATPENPRTILLGDPYWTDGLRAVMVFSEEPIGTDEIGFLNWSWRGGEKASQRLRELEAQTRPASK